MTDSIPAPAIPGSFKDRTIIVSGAAGTIGRVICAALGAAGANVIVNDVKADLVEALVSALASAGQSAHGIPLSSATSSPSIIEQTIAKFGAVHAVINATLGPIPWKPFEQLTDDDFRTLFEANVIGPLALARAAWPLFKAQKFGRIVNFTSDSVLGMPTASTYTMTKGSLFGCNKTLAMEGEPHNIKINCVSPVAYKPSMEAPIKHFSEEIKNLFREKYKPEGNVPLILALVSESCEASGEVFNTAGWAAGRTIWGTQKGEMEMRTVDECLEKINSLCERNTREVFEARSMIDFTEFQAKYVMGL